LSQFLFLNFPSKVHLNIGRLYVHKTFIFYNVERKKHTFLVIVKNKFFLQCYSGDKKKTFLDGNTFLLFEISLVTK